MPLYRRLPKRGFNNAKFRTVYSIVNVSQLEKAFDNEATVDAAAIRDARLVNAKSGPIKVLGGGELTKKLHITADRFSKSAVAKIEAAGGTAATG
jgi:large subunit ribosomal protein L15